jgi:hypothetical protein
MLLDGRSAQLVTRGRYPAIVIVLLPVLLLWAARKAVSVSPGTADRKLHFEIVVCFSTAKFTPTLLFSLQMQTKGRPKYEHYIVAHKRQARVERRPKPKKDISKILALISGTPALLVYGCQNPLYCNSGASYTAYLNLHLLSSRSLKLSL